MTLAPIVLVVCRADKILVHINIVGYYAFCACGQLIFENLSVTTIVRDSWPSYYILCCTYWFSEILLAGSHLSDNGL